MSVLLLLFIFVIIIYIIINSHIIIIIIIFISIHSQIEQIKHGAMFPSHCDEEQNGDMGRQ